MERTYGIHYLGEKKTTWNSYWD